MASQQRLWSRHALCIQEGSTGTEEGFKPEPSAGNEAEEAIIVHESRRRQRRRRVRGRTGPPWLEDASHFGNYQWKSPQTPKSQSGDGGREKRKKKKGPEVF